MIKFIYLKVDKYYCKGHPCYLPPPKLGVTFLLSQEWLNQKLKIWILNWKEF